MTNKTRIEQQAQTIFGILDGIGYASDITFFRNIETGRYTVRVNGFDTNTHSTSTEIVTGASSRDALAQACQLLVK
jgi:hypothetical protein